MKSPAFKNKFKKDLKRCLSRGLKQERFKAVFDLLCAEQNLPEACRPHKLSGEYEGLWECHISPDWLLIYEYIDEEILFHRTGSHADLFR
jgi:mRNA interferase YafQ